MIFAKIPDINSKWFKLRSHGGLYDGIKGSPQVITGSSLNNCTAGVWGLVALNEDNDVCRIGCGNRVGNQPYDASEWLYKNTDKYPVSEEPIEGGVVCFENHVMFINHIYSNGDIQCIESGYTAKNKNGLWFVTLKKSNNYERGVPYGKFEGFKSPNINAKQTITTEQAIRKMALDVIGGKYGNGLARQVNLYKAIQKEVNKLCS